MSWITVLWSMLISACLSFALLHFFFWAKGIQQRANLSFASSSIAAAAITASELLVMHSTSIEHVATLMRGVHFPLFVLFIGIIFFVRFYFDAGRTSLAWVAVLLRILVLIMGSTTLTGQTLFFKEISELKRVSIFGGETISIVKGVLNPWYAIGALSVLALAVFVLDATLSMWRRGTDTDRRRAVTFSAGFIFFLLIASGHFALVHAGLINSPYTIGILFMPILLAMSYELSCDVLHSAQLADRLQANESELRINKQRMRLAAGAAELRLWEWDIVHNKIWGTNTNHLSHGILDTQKAGFESFLNIVYEQDRAQVRLAVEKSLRGDGDFECEYRIKMPDGKLRWFNSRGRIEFDHDKPLRMQGVSIDITRRKQAELEVQLQRNELTHLSRVTLLGEISCSLAHELNQPLTAILSNAQAAQRFLARDPADLVEVQSILTDIISEDKRAGDIIHRLRLLLKKEEAQHVALNVNKLVHDVLKLVNSDLVNNNITVTLELEQTIPAVIGDRVQLQQVLLNLIMNACDVMSNNKASKRHLVIRTELSGPGNAQVSVGDQGPGIPAGNLENIFEPFFTTKVQGMGLGLTICRNIISTHGGQLWASNNDTGGAVFHFTLPLYPGESA